MKPPFPSTRARLLFACVSLIAATTIQSFAQGEGARFAPGRPRVSNSADARGLTAPSAERPSTIVAGFLRAKGVSPTVLASLRPIEEFATRGTGRRHVRLEQEVQGLRVYGAYVKAALNDRGELVHLIDASASVPPNLIPPTVGEPAALATALEHLHPEAPRGLRSSGRSGNTTSFAGDAKFFHREPTVTRVAIPMSDGSLQTGFLVETWTRTGNLLDHTLVGSDGAVLRTERRTSNDRYNVFVEDPSKNAQAVVEGPGSGSLLSPAGWLGAGTQSTLNISGNNVRSYLDSDANNRPDRGGTTVADGTFLSVADLTQPPTAGQNRNVAVQNLFYLNNVAHDILYFHGFTEAVGNFQEDNFGKGGRGSDSVLAEAQDGSGTDNANFATPADGSRPRMQMFLWSGVGPDHEVRLASPDVRYGARGAEFGPALNTTGIQGIVVAANDGISGPPPASGGPGGTPTDACEALPAGSLNGRIALVDRGYCNFTVKVRNAQAAGAVAVVVANNVGTTESFLMGGTDRKVRIPAVMVGRDDGQALRTLAAATPTTATTRKLANPPLQIDGDLDSDIVFHEYGHGLTWRMIGGMSGPLAGAIGEGASDVLAFLMNGDDRIGEYSTSDPRGIRRDPYTGYPRTYAQVTGAEVHDDGEIYAAILWRLRELFLEESPSNGNQLLFAHFVDGMNFTPSTPTFEDMRDGMLASVTDPYHRCLVWRAFAQFGVGFGASGVVQADGTVTITPSTTVPAGVCP
ncbi:MAG: M36 family metallopeptidase [Verrucomicrobiales bacterium]|nr:M36 family metallopeptidase [Verrucomicrobiales bacterium]